MSCRVVTLPWSWVSTVVDHAMAMLGTCTYSTSGHSFIHKPCHAMPCVQGDPVSPFAFACLTPHRRLLHKQIDR